MKDYVEVHKKDKKKKIYKTMKEAIPLFLNINDKLNSENISIDFLDALLTSEDINSEIDKVSVGYMYVSTLAAFAEERFLNFKDRIKKYSAVLDEKVRDGGDGEIIGRVTDAKVMAWVQRNRLYQSMQRKLNFYKRQQKIFEAAMYAFDLKTKMLQTKSVNIRRMEEIPESNNPKRFMNQLTKKERK